MFYASTKSETEVDEKGIEGSNARKDAAMVHDRIFAGWIVTRLFYFYGKKGSGICQ